MKYHQLAREERYTIAYLKQNGASQAEIARQLNRSPSTISRELVRNATTHDGAYRPSKADRYARARRSRSRRNRQFTEAALRPVVRLLKKKWSPEQIAGVFRRQGKLIISHETIYRYVWLDKKFGGTLYTYLRHGIKQRRKRYKSKDSRGRLAGKKHISERPEEVEQKMVVGHFEGDTVIGADRHHCLLTLLERATGFVYIRKLSARTKEETSRELAKVIKKLGPKIKTITFDNGTEFHDYAALERRFGIHCYFATPYHSWERGANENVNGLIRQYVPKGTCMKQLTQRDCDKIAYALNTRPRKRHDYKTPMEMLNASA